ncbi:hypothetical protein HYU95_02610 [Candidatus Daviesbacteria bacterium]|nr:hypothetical protein [Candidatus Daviesbacteria bacterium]
MKQFAKRHLKKLIKSAYYKKVDPQLPDSQKPTVINFGNSFFDQLKNWRVFIPTLTALVLLAALSFYLWQQKTPVKTIPAPESKPQETASLFPPPTDYQKGPFLCPGIPQFCQTGKDIFIEKSYIGFGSRLPAKSHIFASFDGELATFKVAINRSPADKKTQNILVSTLTDKEHLLRAAYFFTGQAPKDRPVKKGEVIATSSGETMPLYDNSSLVFVLTRNDIVMGKRLGGERVQLKKADFQKSD